MEGKKKVVLGESSGCGEGGDGQSILHTVSLKYIYTLLSCYTILSP